MARFPIEPSEALEKIACEAMTERGLLCDFPTDVQRELETMHAPASPTDRFRDLRDRLWVSIDNDDSRDLDQLTVADKHKIYVAVDDVDGLVKTKSSIDRWAGHNTTSVYTPAKIFPMLPLKLSNNLTSLNEHEDRCAIIVEINVDEQGQFELADLYPALVRNQKKLAYNSVAKWLEEQIHLPDVSAEIHEQLKLQDDLAQRIARFRSEQGALGFATIEMQASVIGGIVKLEPKIMNRAHRLIENYMIAANIGVTHHLRQSHLPTLRRVVRRPKRWDRIMQLARGLGGHLPGQPNAKALRDFLLQQQQSRPERFHDLSLAMIKLIGKGEYMLGVPGKTALGHFDLALIDYAHTTAPNRRYPDLIMQRLLKSQLFEQAVPYSQRELLTIAQHCTEKENDATKVERRLFKSAAAMLLVNQIGQVFEAMVTGASPKGTWVRLIDPPIEGRLTHGFEDLDVGDYITVRLTRADIHNGHIDFSYAK